MVPPFSWRGEAVSSSLIRGALQEGDVARAADFLGRPWLVRARGRPMATSARTRSRLSPTANMHLPRDRRLRYGIYAVRMRIDGVSA